MTKHDRLWNLTCARCSESIYRWGINKSCAWHKRNKAWLIGIRDQSSKMPLSSSLPHQSTIVLFTLSSVSFSLGLATSCYCVKAKVKAQSLLCNFIFFSHLVSFFLPFFFPFYYFLCWSASVKLRLPISESLGLLWHKWNDGQFLNCLILWATKQVKCHIWISMRRVFAWLFVWLIFSSSLQSRNEEKQL